MLKNRKTETTYKYTDGDPRKCTYYCWICFIFNNRRVAGIQNQTNLGREQWQG